MKDDHIRAMQQDAFKRAEHEGYDFDGEVCDLFMGTFSDHARYFTITEYIRMLLEDTPLPADVLQELKDRSGMTHLIYSEWEKNPQPFMETLRQAAIRAAEKIRAEREQAEKPPADAVLFPAAKHKKNKNGKDSR